MELEIIAEEDKCLLKIRATSSEAKRALSRLALKNTDEEEFIIHCLDLLYLMHNYRNKIKITIGDREILDFTTLAMFFAEKEPNIWIYYEVYYDLRKRGRIVRPGARPGSLLVVSKKTNRVTHYILILEQNKPIRVSYLKSFIEEALKNKWEPITAIVDSYGDITYYSPRMLIVNQ